MAGGEVRAEVDGEDCLILRFVSLWRDGSAPIQLMREEQSALPIQVTGLNIAQPFWLTTTQQNDVGGEEIVRLQTNDVADLDASPRLGFELRANEHHTLASVEICVRLMPFLCSENNQLSAKWEAEVEE